MRTFRKYAPLMIAKHVASFFKGQFIVESKGTFTFDGGKVVIDDNCSESEKLIGREVNKLIASFLASSRTLDVHYK